MNILLVAATEAEIQPFLSVFCAESFARTGACEIGPHRVQVCVTGVGMLRTSYAVQKALSAQRFDLALQAGIAGSFDRGLELGQVVLVQSEQIGDLGAEDHDQFLDVYLLGLEKEQAFPYRNARLECPLHLLPFPYRNLAVNGLTVNMVSGSAPTIELRRERYDCQTESMEGAAFHYVCLMEQVPFAQVRAISNYVVPRDRSSWKIQLAVRHLNDWLIGLMREL